MKLTILDSPSRKDAILISRIGTTLRGVPVVRMIRSVKAFWELKSERSLSLTEFEKQCFMMMVHYGDEGRHA